MKSQLLKAFCVLLFCSLAQAQPIVDRMDMDLDGNTLDNFDYIWFNDLEKKRGLHMSQFVDCEKNYNIWLCQLYAYNGAWSTIFEILMQFNLQEIQGGQ